MTKSIVIAALLLLPGMAQAQSPGCQFTSGPLQLQKVRSTASGSQIYGCLNASLDAISASSASLTGSTAAASNFGAIYVNKIGGRSVGAAGIDISSAVTVTGGSVTITSGGGIRVTYGITAASGSFTGGPGVAVTYGLTAATAAFVNRATAADYTATYGITAATAAFSSGITASSGSFTATGAAQYSITTSSGIKLPDSTFPICWGSNCQFGPATSLTGAMTTIANNSMASGSGITFLAGSTITVASGYAPDLCVRVAYASGTAVSELKFVVGIDTTSAIYEIWFQGTQNTGAARWQIDFNADSTSGRYRWGVGGSYSDLNYRTEVLATAVSCYLNDDIATVGAGYGGHGKIGFGQWQAGTMTVDGRFDHDQDASTLGWINSTCHYNAVAPVTIARLFTSANTFTVEAELYKCVKRP